MSGFHVIATSRRLAESAELVTKLVAEGASVELYPAVLDLTAQPTIAAFVSWFREKHGPALHALVSNAGFAFKGDIFGAEEARKTFSVNLVGTHSMTEAMLPLLRSHCFVFMVHKFKTELVPRMCEARPLSLLPRRPESYQMFRPLCRAHSLLPPQHSPRFHRYLLREAHLFLSVSIRLCDDFVEAIAAGNYREKGWPKSMYGVSKLAEIAYSKVLPHKVLCFHPPPFLSKIIASCKRIVGMAFVGIQTNIFTHVDLFEENSGGSIFWAPKEPRLTLHFFGQLESNRFGSLRLISLTTS